MPFVHYLMFDDVRLDDNETIDPTLEQIFGCLDAFNTDKVRMITLGERAPEADSELPFGGRGCVIGKAFESDHFTIEMYDPERNMQFHLVDTENLSFEKVEVQIGQGTLIARAALVTPYIAKEVVRQFYEEGNFLENTFWNAVRIW
jgi:hypothetical protein